MSEHGNLSSPSEESQLLTPEQEAEYRLRFSDVDPYNLADVPAEHLTEFLEWLRAVTVEREGSDPFEDLDFDHLGDVPPERLQAFTDWYTRKGLLT